MFATEGRDYLRERILTARIALVWLSLLLAVLLTTTEPLAHLPWLAAVSALFILAFRLWDDLADLAYDRSHHPERGLPRTLNPRRFHVAKWLLLAALAGLLLWLAGERPALTFLGLLATFAAMYRVTAKRPALRPLRVALVLVKYPAFVLLLAQHPDGPATLLVALAVYLLPLLDEVRSTGPGILLPAAGFVGLSILAWLALST